MAKYLKPQLKWVKGELPRERDIVDWSEDKIVSLLHFIDHFTHNGQFKVNLDLRRAAELQSSSNPHWEEFLERIDVTQRLGGPVDTKFSRRFMTLARTVLSFLKKNPYAISAEMSRLMKANPRCHWALNIVKEVPSLLGPSTVQLDNNENLDPSFPNANRNLTDIKSPQIQFNEAIIKMTSILNALTKGIKASDLQKMGVADKIKLANTLINSLAKVHSAYKPNNISLNKININVESKDDLERAILDYAEHQDL